MHHREGNRRIAIKGWGFLLLFPCFLLIFFSLFLNSFVDYDRTVCGAVGNGILQAIFPGMNAHVKSTVKPEKSLMNEGILWKCLFFDLEQNRNI